MTAPAHGSPEWFAAARASLAWAGAPAVAPSPCADLDHPKARWGNPPCVYLGLPIPGEGGAQATRECATCKGNVRAKLWACLHPGHEDRPETTNRECTRCPDYEAGSSDDRASNATGTSHELNYWRGGN
jgi:hypothetical protein